MRKKKEQVALTEGGRKGGGTATAGTATAGTATAGTATVVVVVKHRQLVEEKKEKKDLKKKE